MDPEESISIQKVKELNSEKKVQLFNDISYICANFTSLSKLIKQLEAEEMLLFDSLNLIESTLQVLNQSNGEKSKIIYNKFINILDKNKGYEKIKTINDIMNGKITTHELDLSPKEISVFNCAPITTCSVERSFSRYKFIMNDRRYSFSLSELHLKNYFIANVNKFDSK